MMISATLLSLLLVAPGHAGVLTDIADEALQVRADHPDVALRVDQMQPMKNLAGGWYFPGPDLVGPVAQTLIQERILARRDDTPVRAALVYALEQENRFSWSNIELEEPLVRVAMIHGYKGLDTPQSAVVLGLAMNDIDASVRAEAVRLVGYRTASKGLEPALIQALQDDAAEVRKLSARSLGWLSTTDGFEPLRLLLNDQDADVRAAAVRALGKIDLTAARKLPELERLSMDGAHPSVQRAAQRIAKP